MEYTTLGKTGLVVSRFALGAMTFGTVADSRPGWGLNYTVDQEQANIMVSAALDAGINFFDTANIYALGRSEEFLGRALGTRRKDVIIATKAGFRMSPALTDSGLSARHIIASAEASLKRLGTDYIDLFQVHTPDPLAPFEETARALDHLVQRGLVRYVGYSNFSGWQAATFLDIQGQHNYAPFISAQMHYSLVARDIEYEIVPFLQHTGLGLLIWSPLSGGFLTGKYTRENPAGDNGRLASFDVLPVDRDMGYAVVDKLREIAAAHGEATPAQVALAWLLAKPFVTSIILGASKPEQFSDNVQACDLRLSREEVEALDALTTLGPLYPYRMPGLAEDPAVLRVRQA